MTAQADIEDILSPRAPVVLSYPGGKNGSGVYQAIINHMPPHDIYIEAFAGGGAILRKKRPAPMGNIAIDRDAAALCALKEACDVPTRFLIRDAIEFLKEYPFTGRELVYCDPPYVMATRTSGRRRYQYEMTDADHERLLSVLKGLPCLVMLSGYYSDLYADALTGWSSITFTGTTRGGPREEWLWFNFPSPVTLHDTRFLGRDYRERERIKRKANRWSENLAKMPSLERQAVLSACMEAAKWQNELDEAMALARASRLADVNVA